MSWEFFLIIFSLNHILAYSQNKTNSNVNVSIPVLYPNKVSNNDSVNFLDPNLEISYRNLMKNLNNIVTSRSNYSAQNVSFTNTTLIGLALNITTLDSSLSARRDLSPDSVWGEPNAAVNNKNPVFLIEPKDTYVVKHHSASLVCSAAYATDLVFTCNDESKRQRQHLISQSIELESGERVLRTGLDVTYNDVLEYFGPNGYQCHCLATGYTNRPGVDKATQVVSRPARIKIAGIKKYFEKQPVSTSVEINSTVELQCLPPQGTPKPIVYWTKDGVPLDVERDPNLILSNEGSLLLSMARLSDRGNYSCVAKNIANQRSTEPASLNVYVNGGWSEWSSWPSCINNCGKGYRKRHRTCNNPEPINNGHGCPGPAVQKEDCQYYCPIDGRWSEWSLWSTCNADCTTYRRRSCLNPAPMNGGKYCEGADVETETCSTDFCPNSMDVIDVEVNGRYNDGSPSVVESSTRHDLGKIALYTGLCAFCALVFLSILLIFFFVRKNKRSGNHRRNLEYEATNTFSPYLNGASLLLGLDGIKKLPFLCNAYNNKEVVASSIAPSRKLDGAKAKFPRYEYDSIRKETDSLESGIGSSSYASGHRLPPVNKILPHANQSSHPRQSYVTPNAVVYGNPGALEHEYCCPADLLAPARNSPRMGRSPARNRRDLINENSISKKNCHNCSVIEDPNGLPANCHNHHSQAPRQMTSSYLTPCPVSPPQATQRILPCLCGRPGHKLVQQSQLGPVYMTFAGDSIMESSHYDTCILPPSRQHEDDVRLCTKQAVETLDHDQIKDELSLLPHKAFLAINKPTNNSMTIAEIGYEGGKLILNNSGVSLLIPPGAIVPGRREKIFLTVCHEDKDRPKLTDGQTLLSPLIFCGPAGLVLKKPAVFTFEHCGSDVTRDWVLTLLQGALNETENPMEWKALVTVGQETIDTPVYCHIQDDGSHQGFVMVETLQGYTLIGHSKHKPLQNGNCNSKCAKKNLCILTFASALPSSTECTLRVYCIENNRDGQEAVVLAEKKMNGRLINEPRIFPFTDNSRLLSLSIANISPGWKNKSPDNKQEIPFVHLWSGNRNAIHCSFVLEHLDPTMQTFSCSITVEQAILTHDSTSLRQTDTINISTNLNDVVTCHSHKPSANTIVEETCGHPTTKCFEIAPNTNIPFKIPQFVKEPLCKCMDVPRVEGNDWRLLAQHLNYDRYIQYFATKQSPTDALLTLWEAQNATLTCQPDVSNSGPAINRLCNVLWCMHRQDAIAILQGEHKNGEIRDWV